MGRAGAVGCGEDPRGDEWKENGQAPIDFLLDRQLANGSFEFMKGMGSDAYATRQVVAALLGNPHPIQVRDLAACDVKTTMLPLASSNAAETE